VSRLSVFSEEQSLQDKILFIDLSVIWSISIVQSRIVYCLFTEEIWFDVGDCR
jgi:hypothetical protein